MRRNRFVWFTVGLWMLLAAIGFLPTGRTLAENPTDQVIARVEVPEMIEDLFLPVYAHVMDDDGEDFAIVLATLGELEAAGAPYMMLQQLNQKPEGREYLLAYERVPGQKDRLDSSFDVLLDSGRHILVSATPEEGETLAQKGFGIAWLKTPLSFQNERSISDQVSAIETDLSFSDQIGDMMNRVDKNTLYTYTGNLSGVNTVSIGGKSYKIASRNTNDTTWQPLYTQYAFEWFESKGFKPSYHNWSGTKRNIVAEKKGSVTPDEIVLITGHLDAVSGAPGADDNASGSVAVMAASEIMKEYTFERTVRFVLFTGEEQGLYGSDAYAKLVKQNGENIVAVLNLDMIAWDASGGPVVDIHTRMTSNSGYKSDKAIADVFENVVKTYGLSDKLTIKLKADSISYSDHAKFWAQGFPAILGIEDDNDFNKYYHTSKDTLDTLNMDYFLNFTKAGVGTIASLAKPVSAPPPPSSSVASDGFESKNFKGGEGWMESRWEKLGNVRISSSSPQEGKFYARLVNKTANLKRSVNLSGYRTGKLTFAAKVKSFEADDKALVMISSDGTNFTTVQQFTSADSNNTFREYEINLDRYLPVKEKLILVFDAEMNNKKDYWFIDNIRIEASK